jgi:magnesium-transporting ATPase (P-type)
MAVLTVIMMQVFYLINCRSLKDSVRKIGLFSNNTVYAGIVGIILLQAAYTYLPFMHELFGSAALPFGAVAVSVLVAFSVVPVIVVDKWFSSRTVAKSRS